MAALKNRKREEQRKRKDDEYLSLQDLKDAERERFEDEAFSILNLIEQARQEDNLDLKFSFLTWALLELTKKVYGYDE